MFKITSIDEENQSIQLRLYKVLSNTYENETIFFIIILGGTNPLSATAN